MQSTVRVLRLYLVNASRYFRSAGFPPGWHEASVQAYTRRSTSSRLVHSWTEKPTCPASAANRPASGSVMLTSTTLKRAPVTLYPACSFE